jgi:hypothetical protein
MKRCKLCLLPETYPNIFFNKDGLCSYCIGKNHFGIEKYSKIQSNIDKKDILKEDFEKFVKKIKGKNEYDCLLLYSGGKDSTYLLQILKEKYNLNILALTVDTGLMSKLAKKNIKNIIKKMKVDHILFTPGNDFYKKVYRYFIIHPNSETYCDRICGVCSDIIHGIGLIEASKRKIPFLALANSPDQTDHYFYEISREKICKSWIPEELKKYNPDKIELKYFWNPKKDDFIPRFLIPFHVLDYPGEEAIVNEISKFGLVKRKNLNSFKTNCHLVWLLQYLDLNKNGYNPYIKNLSRNIQSGKLQCNKIKKLYYTFGIKLLKSDIIKRSDKRYVLNYLNLNNRKFLKSYDSNIRYYS